VVQPCCYYHGLGPPLLGVHQSHLPQSGANVAKQMHSTELRLEAFSFFSLYCELVVQILHVPTQWVATYMAGLVPPQMHSNPRLSAQIELIVYFLVHVPSPQFPSPSYKYTRTVGFSRSSFEVSHDCHSSHDLHRSANQTRTSPVNFIPVHRSHRFCHLSAEIHMLKCTQIHT